MDEDRQTSCKVTFLPDGQSATVPCGVTVAEAAARVGVFLSMPCGGRGVCGKCRVRVAEGSVSEPTEAELALLEARLLSDGVRLACQARITGGAVVEVPQESRALERKEISLLQFVAHELAPNVSQCVVEVADAHLEHQVSDLSRLRAATASIWHMPATLAALRAIPSAVRSPGRQVHIAAVNGRIVSVSPAGEGDGIFGAAVDIGTTTVVAYLFDLSNGQYLGSATSYNPQAQHGADVVSRIQYAMTEPGGLDDLHRDVVGVVNELIERAAQQARVQLRHIYELTVVGNTCMQHLFLRLDPGHLGTSPYVPVLSEAVDVEARDLGLAVNPSANVHVLPPIAGFVGADTVAVILATELTSRPHPTLAIDIGTNGEVALWSGEELLVASCAAGPAFEGAQIRYGMRAGPGAIERVETRDGDLVVHTIGDLPAVGICGSGLFDATAVLLELGLLDTSGRLAAATGPGPAFSRLLGDGADRAVILAHPGETADHVPIVLTQRDIRQVQLAKGAIRAAVELLLERVGLAARDLGEVLLAGAFGNYVNPRSTLRIGLLPPAVPVESVHGVGNAAGAGAALALVSLPHRRRAAELARVAKHIELFTSPEFQEVFAEAMLFR
ncbi:MAG: ASKHA domain-containing protein [Armatimonadetes bacterium]|nr:ASKHA domain-containing protein [Armatimonadota bacterium]